jgi:hypothetical protein
MKNLMDWENADTRGICDEANEMGRGEWAGKGLDDGSYSGALARSADTQVIVTFSTNNTTPTRYRCISPVDDSFLPQSTCCNAKFT